jgi:hypothetical protein
MKSQANIRLSAQETRRKLENLDHQDPKSGLSISNAVWTCSAKYVEHQENSFASPQPLSEEARNASVIIEKRKILRYAFDAAIQSLKVPKVLVHVTSASHGYYHEGSSSSSVSCLRRPRQAALFLHLFRLWSLSFEDIWRR